MISYQHYSHIPRRKWPWFYFTPREMASKDGSLLICPNMMDRLQAARVKIAKPFIITSAYRSPLDNARVGGAPMSMHKAGRAVDIALYNHDKFELYAALVEAGFTGFGFYKTFIHADTGRKRYWGKKWMH